jgi:hypothetical protein
MCIIRNTTAALATIVAVSTAALAEPKAIRIVGDCKAWTPEETAALGVRPWFIAEAIDRSGALFAMHGPGGKLVIGMTIGGEVCLFPFENLSVVSETEAQR